MASDSVFEKKLADLECRFIFQQETLDTLNDQVTKQWRQIDQMTAKVQKLMDQLANFEAEILDANTAGVTSEPPPPHY